jgi:hypothetical protein
VEIEGRLKRAGLHCLGFPKHCAELSQVVTPPLTQGRLLASFCCWGVTLTAQKPVL